MNLSNPQRIFQAVETFRIEIPSWGFANTGTRFGKFLQPAAAATTEEKFSDAGEVHRVTGVCPTIALHVLWDCPGGAGSACQITQLSERYGVQPGSINTNLFQDQVYKHGSFGNPDPRVRSQALLHTKDSIEIAKQLHSRDISMWFADGSNYPGTANIRQRKRWFEEALSEVHRSMAPNQRLLVEYKPFEPAFYHTDIADWGMALELARNAGPKAKVLVDTGHHYQGTNIEQVVAWLLHLGELGGFHFNDRKYADDDLTLGSIDPYQLFRIFHEIVSASAKERESISFMIDQSHNLKGKVEAMVQSVVTAQELYAKASLIDQEKLAELQDACRLVDAEECFRSAFWQDVRPLVREWRTARGLPADPLKALAESGYVEKITKERGSRNARSVSTYA